jgi:DNA mismatch repair protein MutS2
LGDRVQLRSLNTKGVVTALSEDEAEVQVGMLRVKTRLAELDLVGGAAEENATVKPVDRKQGNKDISIETGIDMSESPGIELDLRGKRADEAVDALERYLDAAYLSRLPYVRIIHGKGTGKLRKVVREELKKHPHVKSFEAGGDKEGGEGVTVAKLIG